MSLETTTLGAGCFWCVEAVYQNLRGIASAVSGYMGGALDAPYVRGCLQRPDRPRRGRPTAI